MIAFFPELYPDELLYSACSRYHARAGYRSRESTGRDLFGVSEAKVAIDLPSGLDAFVMGLQRYNRKTVDCLIDEHTLLPFYGPFVPPERLARLRADMRSSRGGAIHGRLGILTSGIGGDFLRFCSLCVEADRERFDETYWHRIHQVPGVEVCPVHRVFLEESAVHARRRGRRDAFVTAEQAVRPVAPRAVEDSNPDHQACLRLAHDAGWLLEQRGLIVESVASYRERYTGLLYGKGLSTYFGPVAITNLIKSLKEFYSRDLLAWLGCDLGRDYTWVHRLMHNTHRAQHPLQHLLLMHFLGTTVREFFELPIKRLPFGEGPWPCLDPTGNHFEKALITGYELTPKRKFPRALFRCDCGFAYLRTGPDESPEARYRADGVVATCPKWEDALTKLYLEGRSLRDLAEHFRVTTDVIFEHLTRLGLTTLFGRMGDNFGRSLTSGGWPATVAVSPELREAKRRLWLKLRKENHDLGRHKLRMKKMSLYCWLKKNDEEWFESQLPSRRPSEGPGVYINWPKRDAEAARAVRQEAAHIKGMPGRPVRVSKTSVAANLGILAVVTKRGELMPLTLEVLAEVSESVEDYAMRRVRWAADCFRAEGTIASTWEIRIRAAVSNKVAKYPRVSAAIKDAMLGLVAVKFSRSDDGCGISEHV
jgi:hypothetical protein